MIFKLIRIVLYTQLFNLTQYVFSPDLTKNVLKE